MAISKEQWEKIENELAGFLGSALFKLGDHEISIQRVRNSESTTVLAVYIDGYIKGEWHTKEETRPACLEQVWRKRYISIYKQADIKQIIKIFGKREAKKRYPNLNEKKEFLDCYFTTAKSLVRQFKRIKGIELMLIGGVPYESMEA
ncbi:hypothetical protein [Pseudoalteromonas gelatinilytica]|uniref:Uncharacterized protein n=1 Tax=Pseudoalteromonas gelatinilytica TaxID=1703256 RepID=A0ABQ1TQI6_9GAMM|nr:hypothetical protein [Pseudoalteromonas profundi]GGF00605.1 hypothetical protein GCM10008027_26820 [Pseudoalteromonas profundi]